jgi:hypothetical protein
LRKIDCMKTTIIVLACCLTIMCTSQAQLRTPAPSSTQTIKQELGIGSIELNYSRPGMKGRKIFGDLVPFGKVWRTGANNATTITFADEVTIGGKKVAAGKYGVLTIPDQSSWTVIITKQLDVTSPAAYKQESDVVRVTATPVDLPWSIETFTMMFGNVKSNSCELQMMWDKTVVIIPITTDVDGKVMAQINDQLINDSRPYFNAALYYMDNGKDLNKALAWFDKAVEQNPKAFWAWYQRANCLAKLGKKQEAITSAKKSIVEAKEAKNDDYVALNEKLLATLN